MLFLHNYTNKEPVIILHIITLNTMFNLFFTDYKSRTRKPLGKAKTAVVIFLFVLPSILSILLSFIWNYSGYLLAIPIITVIIMTIIDTKKQGNPLTALRISNSKTIDVLSNMLKERDYRLYSTEGIDWLISCCQEECKNDPLLTLGSTIKNFCTIVINPIVTIYLGYIIGTSTTENVNIDFDVDKIFFSILFFSLFGLYIWLMMRPILPDIFSRETQKYQKLINDLQYIKIQQKLPPSPIDFT